MKLYFVRHGESEANLLREFSNRGLKHGLTDRGKQQALALAESLRGVEVDKIFTSPLLRAVQTAEILSRELDAPYEIADALREYDCGVLEGKSDEASWQLKDSVFLDWVQHAHWEAHLEQGESFLDIRERFLPFVEWLLQEYRDTESSIVLVGHGGTYLCMLPIVLANVDFPFVLEHPISNTGCIIAESRPEGLFCSSWCGTELKLNAGG